MKFVRRLYSWLFHRCDYCNKRIPKGEMYCSKKCEEDAADRQTFSF